MDHLAPGAAYAEAEPETAAPLTDARVDDTAAAVDLQGRAPVERPSLNWRATHVLDELRRRASRGIICETTGALAKALDVSTDTILRGLKDLAAAGLIEETGLRRGKARAFRLVESPQPTVESPQPLPRTDSTQPVGVTAGNPVGDSPALHLIAAAADAPRRDCTHSSCEGLDECRYISSTPEEFAEAARQMRRLLERFSFGDSLPTFPEAGEGNCDDCRQASPDRHRYGSVDVCRDCLTRRYTVAMRMEAAVKQATSS